MVISHSSSTYELRKGTFTLEPTKQWRIENHQQAVCCLAGKFWEKFYGKLMGVSTLLPNSMFPPGPRSIQCYSSRISLHAVDRLILSEVYEKKWWEGEFPVGRWVRPYKARLLWEVGPLALWKIWTVEESYLTSFLPRSEWVTLWILPGWAHLFSDHTEPRGCWDGPSLWA